MKKVTKAIVHRIIDGKHGPFVVTLCDDVSGSVPFSLDQDVWLERVLPDLGSVVRLFDLRQKRAGWRATTARFWVPEDEVEEQIEKQKNINNIIQYCQQLKANPINDKVLTWMARHLEFDTLFNNIKELLDASENFQSENGNCSYSWGEIFMSKIKNESQALDLFRWQKELNIPSEDFLKKAVAFKSEELVKKSLAKIDWPEFDFNLFLKDLSRLDQEELLNNFAVELENRAEENLDDFFAANYYKQESQGHFLAEKHDYFIQDEEKIIFLEVSNSYLPPRLKTLEIMLDHDLEIKFPKVRLEKISSHLLFVANRPNAEKLSEQEITRDLQVRFKEICERLNLV